MADLLSPQAAVCDVYEIIRNEMTCLAVPCRSMPCRAASAAGAAAMGRDASDMPQLKHTFVRRKFDAVGGQERTGSHSCASGFAHIAFFPYLIEVTATWAALRCAPLNAGTFRGPLGLPRFAFCSPRPCCSSGDTAGRSLLC